MSAADWCAVTSCCHPPIGCALLPDTINAVQIEDAVTPQDRKVLYRRLRNEHSMCSSSSAMIVSLPLPRPNWRARL